MNTEDYEAIIFDLGGVIINLDYERTIKAFEEMGLSDFRSIYTQLSQSNLFDEYETGRISSQHFINKLLPYLPSGTTPNQVVAAWNAMILDVPLQKLQLLDSLRRTHKVFLLSNTNEIHMQKVRRAWSRETDRAMESFFDHIYLSYEVGMRKPDVTIFRHVCEEQQLNEKATLFIDDSPQHTEGAKMTGLHTIHLTDPEMLYAIFS
jgi:putative hydrolase of the HAD superfamily